MRDVCGANIHEDSALHLVGGGGGRPGGRNSEFKHAILNWREGISDY